MSVDAGISPSGAPVDETPGLPAPPSPAPAAIGPYRLLSRLGEGGMGEVWEAEQERPVRRRVALKLIRRGMASSEVLARFESERQALALMNHPSIAGIYDAGATASGRPYFVMERVAGVPVTEYCDRHRLTVAERLELFIRVCEGVQHAHHKGVIHRDLKPSNVLVQVEGDRPVPKIIDFGVAKATAQRLTERTLYTELGRWIGTPEYMSPEQAELTGLDVDTRSDVYSLGALLYELLVGTPPFAAAELREAGFDEMRRRIREDEPTLPSTRVTSDASRPGEAWAMAASRNTEPGALRRRLRGDLDWITIKALEKDRTQRYSSPAELAADLERHLEHRPVSAGPPTIRYRLAKFVRRHRLGVAAGALVAAALVLALAAAAFGLARARQETRVSRQVSDFLVEMFEALDPAAPDPTTSVRAILDRGSERLERELEGEPVARARLMAVLGRAYSARGLMRQARPLLEAALAAQLQHLGEDDPEVADTLHDLGWVLVYTEGHEAALPRFERALQIRERALGPDHPDVAESLTSVADMHMAFRDFVAARRLVDRALRIREKALGPDHLDLVGTLDSKSALLRRAGDLEGGRVLLERALAIREAALGPDHALVGWILQRQGQHRLQDRDFEAAERSFNRALEIHQRALGPDHITLATDLSGLGRVHRARGELDAARSDFERALAIRLGGDVPGDTSPAWILRDLALLDARSGDDAQARTRLERALGIYQQARPSGHRAQATFLLDLARLDARAGDQDTARERLERALAIREQAGGPPNTGSVVVLRDLARLDSRLGDPQRARQRLERALEIHQQAGRPGDTYPAVLWQDLALLDVEAGDLARARQRLEDARRLWEEEARPRREWLAGNAYFLGCLSALEGEREEALDHLRRALDWGYAGGFISDDPRLASLRGDPDFEAIVDEVERRRGD